MLTAELRSLLVYEPNWRRRQAFGWPLAKNGRQHIHSRIDAAELPVTHVTRRQGRPYTLVLNKTVTFFTREQEARARDETDLAWLAATWNTKQRSVSSPHDQKYPRSQAGRERPHMADMPVIVRHQDRGALRLDHRHDQALCRARRAM